MLSEYGVLISVCVCVCVCEGGGGWGRLQYLLYPYENHLYNVNLKKKHFEPGRGNVLSEYNVVMKSFSWSAGDI